MHAALETDTHREVIAAISGEKPQATTGKRKRSNSNAFDSRQLAELALAAPNRKVAHIPVTGDDSDDNDNDDNNQSDVTSMQRDEQHSGRQKRRRVRVPKSVRKRLKKLAARGELPHMQED